MEKLIVESFYGFGDTIFLRPLLIEECKYKDVYVQTPYPELFLNTPVKPIKPGKFLYDFANRAMEDAEGYYPRPKDGKFIRPNYSGEDLKNYRTISYSFSKGFSNNVMSTRITPTPYQVELGKELIGDLQNVMIVKIPSFRHDWECESRTPKTRYMIECMRIAKNLGFQIISLQDYTLGDHLGEPDLEEEWMALCDKTLHGRLSVNQLIGLVSQVDHVVTYPNFLLPLSIFLDKPVFSIYGGSIHPVTIIDPRILPSHYSYVAPTPFCHCIGSHHDCNKVIPMHRVEGAYRKFLDTRTLPTDNFMWDEEMGYGYYPVNNTGVYNDAYYDKYDAYENTKFGEKLNSERVKISRKYSYKRIIDIGIGSGQFVKSVDGLGYDVCEKAVKWLKAERRYLDFYKLGAYNADVVTFFDSFEHIDDIETAIRMCMGRTIVMSIPIFKDKAHVLRSKHFRKDEHFHYFTDFGLTNWFKRQGYKCLLKSSIESDLGREDIGTYVFEYENEK